MLLETITKYASTKHACMLLAQCCGLLGIKGDFYSFYIALDWQGQVLIKLLPSC